MFSIEIFEIKIIIWKFKDPPEIVKSTLYVYENTLNVWNFRDAPHPQYPYEPHATDVNIYIIYLFETMFMFN